jgi:predicted glycoside hydrolase/deacetylase ChbG (UPF0249 family)
MRYLIVNADDFGFSPEVTNGVIEAFQNGIVTDTTVLIRSPYAGQALNRASEVGLPVGVHIDFVTGYLLDGQHSDQQLVGPNGQLTRELYQREFHKQIEHSYTCDELIALRDEIRRQVDLFTQITGEKPSHLDYHFGLHHLPEVMAIYITVAEEYKIPARWGSQYAGKNPYSSSPRFLCDAFRGTPQTSRSDFIKLIEKAWEGVMEICCHPGYYTPNGLADSYNMEREYELAVLTDPALKVELQKLNIKLINFHSLSADLKYK